MNQSTVTGPKNLPISRVPRFWTANSSTSTTREIGTTYGLAAGVTISSPSTADSTEMAGVMIPSPKNSARPNTPNIRSRWRSSGRSLTDCEASASKAINPPSPWLSARMMSKTYFSETTTVNVQKNRDSTPRILPWVIGTCPLANTSLKA